MVPNLYPKLPGQCQRGMMNITLTNPHNNCRGDWGNQLRGMKNKGSISIMFQNMGIICNASYQPIQHKLDNLKKIMINEVISIVGLTELNIDCS